MKYKGNNETYTATIYIDDAVFLWQLESGGEFINDYDYIVDLEPVRVLIKDPDSLGLNRQYVTTGKIKLVDNVNYGGHIWQTVQFMVDMYFHGEEISKIVCAEPLRDYFGMIADLFTLENLREFIDAKIPIYFGG